LNKTPFRTKALFDFQQNKVSFVELVSPKNAFSHTIRHQAAVLMGEFEAGKHIG